MKMELVIRFDYGSIVPWVRKTRHGLRAVGGPDALELFSPVPTRGEGLTAVASFDVRPGDRVPFQANWYPSHEDPPPRGDPSGSSRRRSVTGSTGPPGAVTRDPGARRWSARS